MCHNPQFHHPKKRPYIEEPRYVGHIPDLNPRANVFHWWQPMTKILPMSRNLQNILPHIEWNESQNNFEFATETFAQDFGLNGSPSTKPNFSSTRNSSIPKGAIVSANNLCPQGRRRDLPRLDVGKFMPSKASEPMRQTTYKHQNHRERQLAPAIHSREPANDSCLPSNASTTATQTDIPDEEERKE